MLYYILITQHDIKGVDASPLLFYAKTVNEHEIISQHNEEINNRKEGEESVKKRHIRTEDGGTCYTYY